MLCALPSTFPFIKSLALPVVALAAVMDGPNNDELRTMLAWLVGVEGGGMPRDVFRVVVELLMPFWDPLRRKAQGSPRT